MNSIILHGRLTRDPELKTYTNAKGDGGSFATFGVAVNARMGEEVYFFNCSAFGKSGEALAKWFHKGDGIVVAGEMQSRKKDEKVYWNVKVDQWDFAEKKSGTAQAADTAPIPETLEQIDEEVPF